MKKFILLSVLLLSLAVPALAEYSQDTAEVSVTINVIPALPEGTDEDKGFWIWYDGDLHWWDFEKGMTIDIEDPYEEGY